jgi:hypothetical protein
MLAGSAWALNVKETGLARTRARSGRGGSAGVVNATVIAGAAALTVGLTGSVVSDPQALTMAATRTTDPAAHMHLGAVIEHP